MCDPEKPSREAAYREFGYRLATGGGITAAHETD